MEPLYINKFVITAINQDTIIIAKVGYPQLSVNVLSDTVIITTKQPTH